MGSCDLNRLESQGAPSLGPAEVPGFLEVGVFADLGSSTAHLPSQDCREACAHVRLWVQVPRSGTRPPSHSSLRFPSPQGSRLLASPQPPFHPLRLVPLRAASWNMDLPSPLGCKTEPWWDWQLQSSTGWPSIFVLMRSEVPAHALCARAPGDPPAPPPPSHQPGFEPRALLALLQGALERSPRRYLTTLLSQSLQSSPASLPAGASGEVESVWLPTPPWPSTSIKSVYPLGFPPTLPATLLDSPVHAPGGASPSQVPRSAFPRPSSMPLPPGSLPDIPVCPDQL